MSQNNVGRDSDPPSFTIPIALNSVALALIPISQTYFRRTFEARKIELPYQTEIALGVMPLVVLSAVLFLTFVMKRRAQVRLKCVWIRIAVSACGLVVGQHIIGIWLACLPNGSADLSFSLPPKFIRGCAAITYWPNNVPAGSPDGIINSNSTDQRQLMTMRWTRSRWGLTVQPAKQRLAAFLPKYRESAKVYRVTHSNVLDRVPANSSNHNGFSRDPSRPPVLTHLRQSGTHNPKTPCDRR